MQRLVYSQISMSTGDGVHTVNCHIARWVLTDKIVALSLREVGNAWNRLEVPHEQRVIMGGSGVGFGAVQNLHLLRGIVDYTRIIVHLVHLQGEFGRINVRVKSPTTHCLRRKIWIVHNTQKWPRPIYGFAFTSLEKEETETFIKPTHRLLTTANNQPCTLVF